MPWTEKGSDPHCQEALKMTLRGGQESHWHSAASNACGLCTGQHVLSTVTRMRCRVEKTPHSRGSVNIYRPEWNQTDRSVRITTVMQSVYTLENRLPSDSLQINLPGLLGVHRVGDYSPGTSGQKCPSPPGLYRRKQK